MQKKEKKNPMFSEEIISVESWMYDACMGMGARDKKKENRIVFEGNGRNNTLKFIAYIFWIRIITNNNIYNHKQKSDATI